MSPAPRAGGRRAFLLPLALGLLAAVPGPRAVAHAGGVAVLRSSDLATYLRTGETFRTAYGAPVTSISLAMLGPEAALERLRSVNPEIVVAIGLRAAVFVRDQMPRTPLVFAMVPSPERHDLVGSWITGVSADVAPAIELGVLHDFAPDVRRIGVVVGKGSDAWLRDARAAGRRLHLEVVVAQVSGVEEVGSGLRSLLGRVDALWLRADADIATPEAFRFATSEALRYRIPLLTFSPALVQAGAMAAAAPDLIWVGEKLAEQVRRVQSGERAGDVPSTSVRRVRATANLTTARAIGRELPPQALRTAEVFQ